MAGESLYIRERSEENSRLRVGDEVCEKSVVLKVGLCIPKLNISNDIKLRSGRKDWGLPGCAAVEQLVLFKYRWYTSFCIANPNLIRAGINCAFCWI